MATKLVVDCSTGITTEIELTPEEVAQREADALAWDVERKALEAADAAKASAKASAESKLKALGLTDAEIAAFTQ